MIVVDPRRTETAQMAEYHLQVRPGTDAWCIAAMLGTLVQEDLVDHVWLAEHATGVEVVLPVLAEIDVAPSAAPVFR
jgi:anaerobic selenocysteine-containing dehydrogenase